MRIRSLLILSVIVAQTAVEGFSALASAGCLGGSGEAKSCCCGPTCPDTQPTPRSGLTSSCCDLKLPVRESQTSPPRETTSLPQVVLAGGATALDPLPVPESGDVAAADPAGSAHRAPPLYDLFRAYRN